MESFFRPAHRGEHFSITARREFEDSRLSLDQQVNITHKLLEHAEWEKRSNTIVKRNAITRNVFAIKQKNLESLNERRSKLKSLLEFEESQYKIEIASLTETQSQRAERVKNAARELKSNRESRRLEFANSCYERQWLESCDDLRKIDSHFFSLHCSDTIKKQIEEKKENILNEKEKEFQSAKQWEELRLKRVQEEDDKQQKRRENTIQNRYSLNDQINERQVLNLKLKEKEENEKLILQQLQLIDAESEKQKLFEENEKKKSANRENVAENSRIQLERKKQFLREREEQQLELNRLMLEYKKETEKQILSQKKFKSDLFEYKNYLQQRKEKEILMEKEMNRLIEEDVKREENKRDMKWAKEAENRQQLMAEVTNIRNNQIKEKNFLLQENKKEKELEKNFIDSEIQANLLNEKNELIKENQLKLIRAAELEAQIKLNYYKEKRMEMEKLRAKKECEMEEKNYQQRLNLFRNKKIQESQQNYHINNSQR